MNAAELIRTVPLGAVVAYSDGTPRPPERFTKKLAAWKTNNGVGMLTRKTAAEAYASSLHPYRAGFTLREGEYGTASTLCIVLNRSYDESSALDFTVESLPTGPVVVNASGDLVTPGDLARRTHRGDPALQSGDVEHPAGYGADAPSVLRPRATLALALPGVGLWAPFSTDAGRIALRTSDGAHVIFPGTFGAALTARLARLSDDAARAEVLLGLMAARLEHGQTIAPGSLGLDS